MNEIFEFIVIGNVTAIHLVLAVNFVANLTAITVAVLIDWLDFLGL